MLFSVLCVLSLGAVSASAQTPWMTAPPLYGVQTLNTGFTPDPVAVSIQAGGSDAPATALGATGCTGMITSAQPDVRLMYTAGTAFPLNFTVNSGADTTLIVNAPDSTWHCNDDTNGFNPAVTIAGPQSGQYDIWVGIWGSQTQAQPAVLQISELSPSPVTCTQNAQGLTGASGTRHFVTCPGSCTGGTIWGTGTYSDDSAVCQAAVHAGILSASRGGTIVVTIADGLTAYPSSIANGVTSSTWGQWSRSFMVTH
jgi:hypothetical protein